MFDFYETCGYIAGILFASSLIPQLYKSCKTKNLKDISIGWQLIFIFAIILGLIYSIHNDLKPVYISSLIELCFMILLLIMKIIYSDCNKKINDIENQNP
jgi:uncharacterized protein with PQ loop repeat